MTFDRLHAPLNPTSTGTSPLVEARFIPRQYEPNYAYPLLVLLHGRGGDEEQLVRAMPALSWRNYVGLGLRGPELVTKRDRLVGFGWGAEFEQPERRRARNNEHITEAEIVRRVLYDPEPTGVDRLEAGVFTRHSANAAIAARPFRADFPGRLRRRSRRRLLARPDFPRAVRRRRRDQRLAPGGAAASGPAQSMSRLARAGRAWSLERQGPPP